MKQEWMKDLLAKAEQKGFSDFEIYMESSKRFSTSVFKGELDKFSASEPAGISVRGVYNGSMGNAYTEKMDEESLERLLEDCMTNAQINETEEAALLYAPTNEAAYKHFPAETCDLLQMTPSEKIEMLKAAEKAATEKDSRVDQVQNYYGDFATAISIVNSKGLDLSFESCMGYTYFAPILKEGEETKNELTLKLFKNKADIGALEAALESVEKTAKTFGGEVIPSGSYKTVIGNNAMASLLMVMSSIYSAEAADKGLTYFKDKVGQIVASPIVNIIDNPHLENGFASTPFDSEGVPTKCKRIIDGGKLTGFLHNLKTAGKFGVEPTGNGFKASFKSSVGIGATNFYLEKGDESFDALIERVGEGVYLTGLDGLHAGISAITGDFSLACRGFKIEAGKLTNPIHQITVSGNYFEMLKGIEGIANDFVFDEIDSTSVYGSASAFVGSLVISGL